MRAVLAQGGGWYTDTDTLGCSAGHAGPAAGQGACPIERGQLPHHSKVAVGQCLGVHVWAAG